MAVKMCPRYTDICEQIMNCDIMMSHMSQDVTPQCERRMTMKAIRVFSMMNYFIDYVFLVDDEHFDRAKDILSTEYRRYWDEDIGDLWACMNEYLWNCLDKAGIPALYKVVMDFYPDDDYAIESDDVPLWYEYIGKVAQSFGGMTTLTP